MMNSLYAKFSLCMICTALCLCASETQAQVGAKKAADQRVEKLVKSANLKYEVMANGDLKLINELRGGRTQVVLIASKTSTLSDIEIREVWSVGYAAEGGLSESVMRQLLTQNGNVKLGSWQIVKAGEKELAIFSAQIAADTDEKTLLLAIQAVTSVADEMEEKLAGNDDR